MNNDMDDDVKDLLAILQQTKVEEKTEVLKPEKKVESKVPKVKKTDVVKPDVVAQKVPKKEKNTIVATQSQSESVFLANIVEPDDKSIYNSKVLIREEVYEIFMSLKRIKKFKSVSTLVDFALEEYIRNNREDIKNTLYSSKKHEIL